MSKTFCCFVILILLTINCSFSQPVKQLSTQTLFNPVSFDSLIIASPLLDDSHDKPSLIVPTSNGLIVGLDAEKGSIVWQLQVPRDIDHRVELIATPVKIGHRLVVIYQSYLKGLRVNHKMLVFDLKNRQLDQTFPILTLTAEKNGVQFDNSTAFSHAELKHINKQGTELGLVYAAFGGAQDTQPFHGWLFEISLDAWRNGQNAIANVLLTTPEKNCQLTDVSDGGTREMVCGGGIWTPSGIHIEVTAKGHELFIPTGNGQIDLARKDYANTLMRVGSGLQFDDACNKALCQNFDPNNPNETCISSCKNLFIPRLKSDKQPLKLASGECDNKTYWQCLAYMDYDLGASSPVIVNIQDKKLIVQPSKDGNVFLIDAEHLGKQYDQINIVEPCGTKDDPCLMSWAGMIVTKPVITTVDNETVVIIPTFVADNSHTAGVVALKITITNGEPKLTKFWQFPTITETSSKTTFRTHPSMPVLTQSNIVWLVDVEKNGTLYGIRVQDGTLATKQILTGTGRGLTTPLIYNNKIYLVSVIEGKGSIEAFSIDEYL